MDPDLLLLRRYAKAGDQEAFAAIVRRYVDIVFAAAMRQMGDAQQAEDVTQAVFVLLSQKASKIGDTTLIGGWLVNATRLVCKSAIRSRQRRQRHEQRAAAMRREMQETDPAAEQHQISEQIDEALSRLDQTSRGVLVMQYIEGRSGREMAEVLGISEDAARKRASRALGELRRIFARRGVAVSADVLGAAMIGLKMSAPNTLALAAAGASCSTAATGLAKSAAAAMVMAKAQVAVMCVATALAVAGTTATVAVVVTQSKQQNAQAAPTQQQSPSAANETAPVLEPIRGIVLDPAGKPVEGAMVLIGKEGADAWVYGKPRNGGDATTDKDGRFEATRPKGSFAIVVRSPAGFAEVGADELKDGTPIQLVKWGTIEGTAYVGGKITPRARVSIWRVSSSGDPMRELVNHQTNVMADAKGHFVFPQVAPGEIWIKAEPGRGNTGRGRGMDWHYAQVASGEALVISPGGANDPAENHTVIGRIEAPEAIKNRVDWLEKEPLSYDVTIRVESSRAETRHEAGETPTRYREIEQEWGRTPEGKLAKEWMFGRGFAIKPDGSFQIDRLPAGEFNLSVRNFEHIAEVSFLEDVAGLEKRFTISADQGADKPVDLGTLTLSPRDLLRAGAAAPDFSVKLLDGGEWKLADHAGKCVVLIMWGAYQNRQEMKELSEVAKRYINDPRLSFLGVYVAESDEKAREYIERYGLDFPNTPDGSKIMTLYDNSWPSALLIDADGHIAQKHLNAKVLEKYIKRALEN